MVGTQQGTRERVEKIQTTQWDPHKRLLYGIKDKGAYKRPQDVMKAVGRKEEYSPQRTQFIFLHPYDVLRNLWGSKKVNAGALGLYGISPH
jgi:hypothetical protein